ncbi:MAG: hypothetical protein NXI01_06670 [Gammaproteobacteria bacterium]|nr:hypothetical protein [Gammaproteobacteria bacterium]
MPKAIIIVTHFDGPGCSVLYKAAMSASQSNTTESEDNFTVVMAANYTTNFSELSLKKGCPRIDALKETITPSSSNATEFFSYPDTTTSDEEKMIAGSPFGRLFFAAKEKYKLRPEDIGIVIEGNMSISAGKELTPHALACVNVFNPIVTSFFTSTVECRTFIRYWARCKGYRMFEPLLGSAWMEESEQMCMEEFEQKRKQQRPMDGFRPIGGKELLIARHPKPQIAVLNKTLSVSGANTKYQVQGVQIILEALRSYSCVSMEEVNNDSQGTDQLASNVSSTEAGFFKSAPVLRPDGDKYLVRVETPPSTAMNSDETATSLKLTTSPFKASTVVAAARTLSDVPTTAAAGCLNRARQMLPYFRIFGTTKAAPIIPVNQSLDGPNTAGESYSNQGP